MRLGGPVFGKLEDPQLWAAAVKAAGYRAAYCPISPAADDATVRAFAQAASDQDLVIAETGAWSNPISRDEAERAKAVRLCIEQLTLAERVGARCCVNIAGSRGAKWDGPDADNYSPDTFDLIVETVRRIIDAVKPTRTVYSLETMPWAPPDSAQSYLKLVHAIDRKGFGVHLDPVNLVNSPRRYYQNAAMLRDCFAALGPWIRSCHAKDIRLDTRLTVHLDEVRPGLGGLDYGVYLSELAKLDPDTPVMLEHLPNQQEYVLAAQHLRSVATDLNLLL